VSDDQLKALIGRSVTVSVPATVANLGAGYDVLALALDYRNELTVRVSGFALPGAAGDISIVVEGEGLSELPSDKSNVMAGAVVRGLAAAGVADADRLSFEIKALNRIPLARGLGSSAAAFVGALFAGAALAGASGSIDELPGSCADLFPDDLTDRLFAAADDYEGHPDNASAAIFGGLVASARVDGVLTARLIALPEATIPVIAIPELRLPTSEMRAVLPNKVPMEDAVHNASRMAAGIAALEAGDVSGFALLADDRLHQPYRAAKYRAMPALISAAVGAGAVSASLAGAGSSVLAIVDDASRVNAVSAAMEAAISTAQIGGGALRFDVDTDGVRIETYEGFGA
jgi:homoserine kinase